MKTIKDILFIKDNMSSMKNNYNLIFEKKISFYNQQNYKQKINRSKNKTLHKKLNE
jgi:PhoPQ-activated pathogenicity-related protein